LTDLPVYLGVDIGGTKVAAGLVNSAGAILHKTRVPMSARAGAAAGFACVQQAVRAVMALDPRPPAAIGICSPGPLDPVRGLVLNPPNLPCWRDFPLADEIQRAFALPTHVDNDANAAALAETLWGAGRGHRHIFYASLGTGIGTGIIIDRHIYHGRTGAAAEGGHITLDPCAAVLCSCGKPGCIEGLIAGPGIGRRAAAALDRDPARASTLRNLSPATAAPKHVPVTAESVGEAFRAGDPLATEVLLETAHLLAVWLGNIVDLLEPEVIILGGGVCDLLLPFLDRVRAALPRWSINQRCHEIPILQAHYGVDAGIAGGAALCL
jgi:glucokinase